MCMYFCISSNNFLHMFCVLKVPSSAGADAGREASEELQEVIALIEKLEGERKQVMAEIKRIDEEIRTLGACFSKEVWGGGEREGEIGYRKCLRQRKCLL